MKVTQVNSPHAIQQTTTNTRAASEARERAINKALGQPTQTQHNNPQAPTPVNPNQVQPEEMGAITPQVPQMTNQNTTNVDSEPEVTAAPTPPQAPDAQLQALVRREKALRMQVNKQQEAFKAQKLELDRRQAELDAKAKDLEQGYIPKSRIKQDTLGVLAEAEVTYDDITQQQLQVQNVNPQVKAMLNKLEASNQQLQAKLDQLTKNQESANEESTQAALKQIGRDASSLVTKDSSGSYEFIKAHGKAGIQEVVKLIKAEFDETGDTMDTEEALQLVEQEYEQRFDKFSKLNKVQKRLQAPTAQSTESKQTQVPNQQPQQMKTLTNAAGSTRQLSGKERAILAFEGKLKS